MIKAVSDSLSLTTYGQLPSTLRQICGAYFQQERAPKQPRWCDEGMRSRVGAMWRSYRLSKGHVIAPTHPVSTSLQQLFNIGLLRKIFHRWHHRSKFSKAQLATRKHGRDLKKQRMLDLLEEARSAIINHNQHGLFRVVRSIAPKQRKPPLQIFGKNGEIVSKTKELEILKAHFEKVWRSPEDWKSPTLATSPQTTSSNVFYPPDETEITHAVETMRAHKAVPHTFPPSAIWKKHSSVIGSATHRITRDFWQDGGQLFPPSWRDTHIILLQKPNKPPGVPPSMRPIGLQDPLAKAYAMLLAKKLTPFALEYLRDVPQFAYVAGRDILGSLERAVRRCKGVRRRTKAGSYNIWSRKREQKRQEFTIGLQASLDLSQAFDTAPWQLIEAALVRAAVPSCLREAIMQWVTSAKYLIEFRSTNHSRGGAWSQTRMLSIPLTMVLVYGAGVQRILP